MNVLNIGDCFQEISDVGEFAEAGELRPIEKPHVDNSAHLIVLQERKKFFGGLFGKADGEQCFQSISRSYGSIPIINGLTDFCHPCQVLADLMTIREYKGSFDGLKMCYIGDGNNMANSLIVGGLKVGMEVSIACPDDYRPDPQVMEFTKEYGNAFSITNKPVEAAVNADVILTDVWSSMGMEAEIEKRKIAFAGYQVNDEIMAAAHADAMVMHCLPAHREEEITSKVFEAHAAEIFDEAENRLHAQKAVMVKLMGEN